MTGKRASRLTTLEMHRLDVACQPIWRAFGHGTYLVGSASIGAADEFRDVDVRTILPDEEFDALFAGRPALWELICTSVGQTLYDLTGGLPVDYQIQRMTEANANFSGPRNPIGTGRPYAGLGDATGFDPHQREETEA